MIENNLHAIVDNRTRVLIIGSMPGQQSLEKQQYYGNPRNHFWPIMGELLQVNIPDNYEERLQLLRQAGIGLWDAIARCERSGSLDATIKREVPNDFSTLFAEYPHIQCVLFNGGKAFTVFKKHVGVDVLEQRFFAQLPSTSPVPGKNIKSFEEKIEAWSVLKTYIKER